VTQFHIAQNGKPHYAVKAPELANNTAVGGHNIYEKTH
jgi:hypothetical protein